MTEKEKADELYQKYFKHTINFDTIDFGKGKAKECALICVDEILDDTDASSPFEANRLEWWQKVKTEIEKL